MKKSNKIELIKNILITILIMLFCFILIDLYIPIKRLIIGDSLKIGEILSYIKISQHLPVIIAVSVALGYERNKKSK